MEDLIAKSFSFGDFEVDGPKRLLRKHGEPVALNSKTFDLLTALIERHGEVVSKDELLAKVWPDQFVEEGNLTVQISTLRKIFGERKDEHRFIVTVPGRGYSFVADLEVQSHDDVVIERSGYSSIVIEHTVTDGIHTSENASAERSQLKPAAAAPSYRYRWVLALFLAVVVTFLAAGYWVFHGTPPGPRAIRSVAVLPFVNDSGNADLEYLSDGLTESLIGSLSQLQELSVKASSTVSRYKGTTIDPRQVGTELAVESILTGRLIQRGDEVALYVEFIEPSTASVLWKAEYRRPMGDLAALDEEISRDVAGKLKTRVSGEETVRLENYQTDNSEAFELYMRGLNFSKFPSSLDRLTKSIDCFEKAIQLDPNYGLAYDGIAWAHIRMGSVYGYRMPHDTFPKAREAAIKALALNEHDGPAHSAMGVYNLSYEWNWPAAEREFEQSVALEPENPGVFLDFAGYYDSLGRFDDAIGMRQRARRLNPVAPPASSTIGSSHYYAGRFDEALEWFNKALELNPRHAWAHLGIGRTYLQMGKYPEAVTEIEKGVELLERNARAISVLGHAYAKAGRRDDANKILDELRVRAKSEYVSPYYFAILFAGMDQPDNAFEYLDQSVAERQTHLILLKVEPLFFDLRSDPRFTDVVKRIGIPG